MEETDRREDTRGRGGGGIREHEALCVGEGSHLVPLKEGEAPGLSRKHCAQSVGCTQQALLYRQEACGGERRPPADTVH